MSFLRAFLVFGILFSTQALGASDRDSGATRLQKCEAGIRSYLAYEKKGWRLVENSAPNGANACRNAVGDVEQTTIVLAADCGSYVFETFQSLEKTGLKKVSGVMPSDTVLDVISKARLQYLRAIKSFCGMEPPPIGVTQDAADCSWFIDIQLKYMKKLNSILASLAAESTKSCNRRFEEFKSVRLSVPEACRRYTLETFPGESVKTRMIEEFSNSGGSYNPGANVADLFQRFRMNALSGLRKQCDPSRGR
jgi:hypothetical protein